MTIKKILTFFLVFPVLSVSADTIPRPEIKEAFDELNYFLTVEWDQKDKAACFQKMDEFNRTISDLQAAGMTTSEYIDAIKAEINDRQFAEDLDKALAVVQTDQMSAQDASEYLLKNIDRFYKKGASWDGRTVGGPVVMGLFVAAMLLAVIPLSAKGDVVNRGSPGSCIDFVYYQN